MNSNLNRSVSQHTFVGDGGPGTKGAQLVHLADAADSSLYGRRVRVLVHVIGKAQQPYLVPAAAEFYCNNGSKRHAEACSLSQENLNIEFTADTPQITAMLGASRTQMMGACLAALPDRCDDTRVREPFPAMLTIEEVVVQPLAESVRVTEGGVEMDGRFVPKEWVQRRLAVVHLDGRLVRENSLYLFEGVVWPDSRTQEATIVVDQIKPLDRPAENFELTYDDIDDLCAFGSTIGQSVEDKWLEIVEETVAHTTHVYGRPELHQALDLALYSAEQFYFDGDLVDGTVDVLIIGDSGQGKSAAAEKHRRHHRLGASVDAGTAGRTGLKGAVEEMTRGRKVKWGVLPQNHRGYVVLDEVGLLPKEDISELRDIRSSGTAHITKAAAATIDCRVRLTMLANPRDGRRIRDFVYGCEAFRDVMLDPDLRRTDLGIILRSGDVDTSVINAIERPMSTDLYDSPLSRKLALFCWSRRPDQIVFDVDAVDYIKACAERLGTKYSGVISLVEPSDLRHKLARLSVALAGRLFASKDGVTILVEIDHAMAAIKFLEGCYDHPASGLDRYARMIKDENEMDFDAIDQIIRNLPNWQGLVDMYDRGNVYRFGDLEEGLGIDKQDRKLLALVLRETHLIKISGHGAQATAKFKSYLAELSRRST